MTRQLITNASIVIGDGITEPYEGDILIVDDHIEHLGRVPPSAAKDPDRHIDAGRRVVCPGFVDMHNHGLLSGTAIGESGVPIACELSLRGGVTKRIGGVDGLSPAPVLPAQRVEYAAQLGPLDGTIDGEWSWSSVSEFYDWYRGRSIVDTGMYLGHGAVRRVVMGNRPGTATDEQLREMSEVVRREAPFTLGLSTGLVYTPAVYSDARELAALVRAFNDVKPAALFPHLRSESDQILPSLDEALTAAIDGGGAYCNEHSKLAGRKNWDKYSALTSRIADASASIPTIENMYPYGSGSTTGDAIFPPELRAGSRGDFLARLRDPSVRVSAHAKTVGDTTSWDNFVAFCGGFEGVQIAAVRPGVGDGFLGQRLGDVARSAGHDDLESFEAYNAIVDFFVANRAEVSIISHYGNDATVEKFFRRPSMAICTDGLVPGPGQKPHPRSLGTFPKALRMARELGIPLIEIIYRMTALPCRFLGLPSPVLTVGADASLVLFDSVHVAERNDFENPLVSPVGIDAVWVHGHLAYEDGSFHVPDQFPGRILESAATSR